jgi:hypothetical protein
VELGEWLVLPAEFGRKEVEWPFTENGQFLDEALKARGFCLEKKELIQLHEGDISLCRHYRLEGWYFYQSKNLFLPSMRESARAVEYHSFGAEDVTWFGKIPAIPMNTLVEKLKQTGVGEEHYATENGDFLIDLSIRSDATRGLRMNTAGVLRTERVYRNLADLLELAKDDFLKSKGQFDKTQTYSKDRLRQMFSSIIDFQ